MITPAWAPSTPASNEPAVLTGLPFWYSVVASPRYQTLPFASCAYQSSVTSTNSPSSLTTSRTTRAVTPFAISFVSVGDRHHHLLPRPLVVGLAIDPAAAELEREVGVVDRRVVNSAGLSVTGSLPSGQPAVGVAATADASAPRERPGRRRPTHRSHLELSSLTEPTCFAWMR